MQRAARSVQYAACSAKQRAVYSVQRAACHIHVTHFNPLGISGSDDDGATSVVATAAATYIGTVGQMA